MGRLHSPLGRDAALAQFRGLAQACRRAASHGAAFAALLALLLAPLHLCCVNHHGASAAASLEAVLGPGAHIALCAHDGGDRQDRSPASPGGDHCPGCCLASGAALIPPPATATVAHAQSAIEILAPPETLGFRAAAAILAARPRGPPILI